MRRAVALAALVAAHLALRLPSLGLLPLYSDEALGMWRAERVLEGSLTRGAGEGKPLHAWMIAVALRVAEDPIRGARAAHAAAGALAMIAVWDLARRLSPLAGWCAAALWVVLPFPLLFERTVTPDVPLAAAGAAVLALALRVAGAPEAREARRWSIALALAGLAASLLKMPVGLLLASTPLLVPFAQPPAARPAVRSRLRPYRRGLGLFAAALAAIVTARAAFGIRPLGFGVHELGLKVAASRDPGSAPAAALENLSRVGEFAWLYLTPAGVVLLLAGVAGAVLARDRLLRVAIGVVAAYALPFVLGARDLSAHYLLPALPFAVVAMGWAAAQAATRAGRLSVRAGLTRPPLAAGLLLAGLAAAIAAPAVPFALALHTDPPSARMARTERAHYVDGSWSGYGLREAARWIEREHAALGAGEAVFAALHLADYERLRLYAAPAVRTAIVQTQVERYTLRRSEQLERLRALGATGRRVYVVTGSRRRFPDRWRRDLPGVRLVDELAKPSPAGDAAESSADAAQVWRL